MKLVRNLILTAIVATRDLSVTTASSVTNDEKLAETHRKLDRIKTQVVALTKQRSSVRGQQISDPTDTRKRHLMGKKGGYSGYGNHNGGRGRRGGGRRRGPKPDFAAVHLFLEDKLISIDNLIPVDTGAAEGQKIGATFVFDSALFGTVEYFQRFNRGKPATNDVLGALTGTCTSVSSLGVDEFGVEKCILHCTMCVSYGADICNNNGYSGHRELEGYGYKENDDSCYPIYGEAVATGNLQANIFPLVDEDGFGVAGGGGSLSLTGANFDLGGAYMGGFMSFNRLEDTEEAEVWKVGVQVPFSQRASCGLQEAAYEELFD